MLNLVEDHVESVHIIPYLFTVVDRNHRCHVLKRFGRKQHQVHQVHQVPPSGREQGLFGGAGPGELRGELRSDLQVATNLEISYGGCP